MDLLSKLYNKWTNTRNTGTIENKYSMIHRPGKMNSKFEFDQILCETFPKTYHKT